MTLNVAKMRLLLGKKRELMHKQISVGGFIPPSRRNFLTSLVVRLVDRMMGLHTMQHLYQLHNIRGVTKEEFIDRSLEVLQISVADREQLQKSIPPTGPVVIASNHPFGGLEGVILARIIGEVRPDLKVLANSALSIFTEISDYFIFTNPLSQRDPKNGPSLRTSIRHLRANGALLVFPAGKVSYCDTKTGRIVEHQWDRLIGRLLQLPNIHYVATFVAGKNSKWFYLAERVYFKLRMVLLAREVLNKKGQEIKISMANVVTSERIQTTSADTELAALARAQSYAADPQWRSPWPQVDQQSFQAIAEPIPSGVLQQELHALPERQCLLSYREFKVYFGFRRQMPEVVREIARLRELVFRQHNEGSGQSRDTDHFDDTYTHLLVFNHATGVIVGAYRMGQTDKLLAQYASDEHDLSPIYLSQMFQFQPEFINRSQPCLEMGRSFLIPEYQRSYQGLYLLWRGIGSFVCLHPQYRYLYGTVSLSKLFDKRSIALIKAALVEPNDSVSAKYDFDFPLHPEISQFAASYSLRSHLSAFLQGIEPDGKDIPVLLKHYMKLGARFHALGVDQNFADTPGLLLSVHLPSAPRNMIAKYLSKGVDSYLDYHP